MASGRISAGGPLSSGMRPALASRLSDFGTTIFTEMTRLAIEHRAINLAQGFPDFDGPEFAKEAAIAAIRAGHGQYARMSGAPELHRALSAKFRRDCGPRLRGGHGDHGDLGRDRGDLRRHPGHLRPGRRGRRVRAVLRLLQGERADGGRRAADRDAPARPTGRSTERRSAARSGRRRALCCSTRPTTRRARSSRARSWSCSPRCAGSTTRSA